MTKNYPMYSQEEINTLFARYILSNTEDIPYDDLDILRNIANDTYTLGNRKENKHGNK